MSEQQTLLRVKTSIPSNITVTGTTSISVTGSTTGFTYSGGTGVSGDPYIGSFPNVPASLLVNVSGNGTLFFNMFLENCQIGGNFLQIFIKHADETFSRKVLTTFFNTTNDEFKVRDGDIVTFKQGGNVLSGTSTYNLYVVPDANYLSNTIDQFEYLDIYNDIPIKINKSFAELQDISKKNSDLSVGLKLPGTKRNNRFFENYYDVDNISLFFDVTKKVQCNVLINDESFFDGFLKLNSISVLNSKVEYDVTLLSSVADLYGSIGNKLLKDLDFRNPDYFFNHTFSRDNVLQFWRYETLKSTNVIPSTYFYPVAHNGYVYTSSANSTVVQTGTTSGTSIYTTTLLGSWANATAAYTAGSERGHINSVEDGVRDNQLKPALNVYALIQMIFNELGYRIKSDFFTTPWFKLLYMYGYFSDNSPKLSFQPQELETFGISGVDLVYTFSGSTTIIFYVVKAGTGTPCLCNEDITANVSVSNGLVSFQVQVIIQAGTPSNSLNLAPGFGVRTISSSVGVSNRELNYLPSDTGNTVTIVDGEYLNMSKVIDENIKQIDFLSSIAKKFNLVLIPNRDNPFEIIIEPYEYYIGKGNIYDWTDKLSWDKGFTVQPAQNLVESDIHLTDKEDGDAGNDEFKKTNNRIYGRNIVYNPTQFKSEEKKIETIFSPQLIRKWNPTSLPDVTDDVGIPLMINYSETSQENGNVVNWTYSGVKTNPRLIFNLGNFSPFLNEPKERIGLTGVTSNYFKIENSDGTSPSGSLVSPVVSHTMPLGNPDGNKINNDSLSILFNTEKQVNLQGQFVEVLGSGSTILNVFTKENIYNRFYINRVLNSIDKNTRILSGNFNLSIRDIDKLEAKDLIKVNNQYFTWNKIDNYNLTSPELTSVELIQYNYTSKDYPTRYFNYQYCSGDTATYKFKTEFTGKNSVYETFYYWSIVYDYFVGFLGGDVSGYTSSIPYINNTYIPYSIWEVDEDTYNSGGTSYINDPQVNYFLLSVEEAPEGTIYNQKNPVFLINSGQTIASLNVFTGCTDFNAEAAAIGAKVLASSVTPPGYTTGITINVTDIGYIKYTKSDFTTQYRYVSSLGNYDIPDCADCLTVIPGFPFADVANFTIVDCGNPC